MKAYAVATDEGYSTVIFAETRGKARSVAMHTSTCEDIDFIKIKPYRVPQFDKCYRGLPEMDWFNTRDRLALVKAGWYCVEECHHEECAVKEHCERYLEKYSERG